MTTSTRRTGPDRDTVMKVLDRDGYRCVRCSTWIVAERGSTWSVHHRKPRGRGGDNSLSNLIALCGSGTTGCHGWVESYRFEATNHYGWLVNTHHDPAAMPVLSGGRWVLLDDQGGSSPFLRDVAGG